MEHQFCIDSKAYRILPTGHSIQVKGWYLDDSGRPADISAQVNGRPAQISIERQDRPDVIEVYAQWNAPEDCGFWVQVSVEQQQPVRHFVLWAETAEGRIQLLQLGARQLSRMVDRHTILYHIDSVQLYQDKLEIRGWADTCLKGEKVELSLTDDQNHPVEYQLERMDRKDVREAGMLTSNDPLCMCGFVLVFPFPKGTRCQLTLRDSWQIVTLPLNYGKIHRAQKRRETRAFWRSLTFRRLVQAFPYLVHGDFRGLRYHFTVQEAPIIRPGIPYSQWYATHKATEEELVAQRAAKLDYSPTISIVVPTYRTPIRFLREMIESVQAQTYPYWELCIGDGSEGDGELVRTIQEYAAQDSRIKLKVLEKNLGISGNTNGALALATGDYIGLLDHDDLLAPNALFEVVQALNEDNYDVLYTDEDKVSADLSLHHEPHFKPDFSPDLLRTQNYICHFFVACKAIVDAVGGFRSEFDGSQYHDFIFRCTERADKIKHIPKILYHWRVHSHSTAADVSAKPYVIQAAHRAIQEHLFRIGLKGEILDTIVPSMYRVKYEIPALDLVSIVICNKDHVADLKKCINSILKKTTYPNYEIIVVENNSVEEKTFAYYRKLERLPRVRVITWQSPNQEFNYSAINNEGVRHAKGKYVLLLNNDTEVISPEWLEEMVMYAQRSDVGAVGAKLYYPDNTIQHAGIGIGLLTLAGHYHRNFPRSYPGYMGRLFVTLDVSAVTAACILIRRDVWDEVGGLDETFKVAFNDVDLCMRIRRAGYLIVWTPYAELYHYESKSRGSDESPEKRARFLGEVSRFQTRWAKELAAGDPYYNPNLTLLREDMTFREPQEEGRAPQ